MNEFLYGNCLPQMDCPKKEIIIFLPYLINFLLPYIIKQHFIRTIWKLNTQFLQFLYNEYFYSKLESSPFETAHFIPPFQIKLSQHEGFFSMKEISALDIEFYQLKGIHPAFEPMRSLILLNAKTYTYHSKFQVSITSI